MNLFPAAAVAALAIFALVSRPGGWAMAGSVAGGRYREGGDGTLGLVAEALASSPALRVPVVDLAPALMPAPPAPVTETETETEADAEARVTALVDLAQAGDAEAFGELFEHFQGTIYRQLYYLTRSAHVAEDLTSETFFRALRAMRKSQLPASHYGPWLRTIAKNLARDHWSAKSTKAERPTEDFSWWAGAGAEDQDIAAAVDGDFVRDALRGVPESQRRVLAMRFLCQLSIEETAAELGATYGATKQLQWRGLRNLERILREQEVT